jgi:carboxyl-terminal processing protease
MPKRNLIWLLVVAVTAVIAVWITRASQQSYYATHNGSASLAEACRLIERNYYGQVDPDTFRREALTQMVQRLDDPYSRYIPPEQASMLSQRVAGSEVGTGLVLDRRDGRLFVEGVEFGSPAQQSILARGQRVLSIDQRPADQLSLEEARAMLSTPVGARHTIRILDPRDQAEKVAELTAEAYDAESVTGLYRNSLGQWVYSLDAPWVYLSVREFVGNTTRRLRQACRLDGTSGVILDLRGNPGGLLPSAIDTANLFLESGQIVEVVEARDRRKVHEARSGGTFPPIPMVVLIDEDAASGAELLAGALQARGRAVLLGRRTRGKGLVQSMLPLSNGQGILHLTTAEFFIDGRAIHRRDDNDDWGVRPDLSVAQQGDRAEIQRLRRRLDLMSNLPREDSQSRDKRRSELARQLLEMDTQLARAVQLLGDPERMQRLLSDSAEAANR